MGNTALVRKLHGIGQQIVDNLAQTQGVANIGTAQLRGNVAMKRQSFGSRKWFKTDVYLFKQAGRMKGDPVDFGLVQIKTMEVEQINDQLQQMFR